MSRTFCAPPHISAQSATVARSATRWSGAQPMSFSPRRAAPGTATSSSTTSQSLRVWSIVGRSFTSRPRDPLGTRNSETPSSGVLPSRVRATTTRTSARCASGTKSFTPESVKPEPPAFAFTVTPPASQRAFGSAHASVAFAWPWLIFGSHVFFCSAEPASKMASPPRRTVAKYGPGMTARPISSISTVRSTKPSPLPPCSSGKTSPSQPCSAIFFQKSSVTPAGSSMRLRTNSDGHSFSRNFRAVERSSSCSSLKPKSIALPLYRPALPFREAEHALADDVLLDLRRAALDRVRARAEERVVPEPAVHRAVRALRELRVGPLDLHRELLELLMRLHPAHLARGRLRTGQLPAQEARDRARAGEPQALRVDPELRELLAHDRALGDDAPVLLHPPRHVDDVVQRDPEPHLKAEAERQPLVHERGEPDLPAVVEPAEDLRLVHAHVVEEDLVELVVAGDLLERLHRHPGRVHVEEEVRDALVLGRVGVRPREQHHPVGDVRDGGPHLLAVDDEVLAVLHRARLQRREVAPRVRLGVALTPDLLAREDLRRVPPLLLVRAPGDDRRARHADAEDVQDGRRLRERHLLLEDHLLHEREPGAPGLLRPREPDEAVVVELALPLAQELVGVGPGQVPPG